MENDELTNPELAVLGLIAESPRHGYEVEQMIEQRGYRHWTEIGFSSIYHILNKLEKTGYLISQRQPSPDRPARKVYHLTAAGRRACAQAVFHRLQSPRPRSSDFDLALAYLPVLSNRQALEAVQALIANLQETLQNLAHKQAEDVQDKPQTFHVMALFDHNLHSLRCELEWLMEFARNLSAQSEE